MTRGDEITFARLMAMDERMVEKINQAADEKKIAQDTAAVVFGLRFVGYCVVYAAREVSAALKGGAS